MCKAVFEEQHRHTIVFALKRIKIKENNARTRGEAADPALEKAIAVLSRYIGDTLKNRLVRETQHRKGKTDDKVFQDAALGTAYKLYSNPSFVLADGKFHMSLKDDILQTTDVCLHGDGGGAGSVKRNGRGGGN
jgi:hypothetical protein